MARISTYTNDTSLQSTDRLIGTDGQGGIDTTNNFTLEDIKDFVNLGVDVAKRTPKFHIPSVTEDSMEAEASSLIKRLTKSDNTIIFSSNPAPATIPAFTTYQVNKATIEAVNPTGTAYIEFENYDSKFDIYSLAGKNFTAVLGPDQVTVTGTFGTLQEIDNKYYRIASDSGNAVFRYSVTKTGNANTTWNVLEDYTEPVSLLTISRTNNFDTDGTSPYTLDLITITSDSNFNIGDTTLQNATVTGNLAVMGEFDATTITFAEDTEGIIFNDKDDADGGQVALRLDTTPVAPIIAGYNNAGSMPTFTGLTETIGGAALESFLNIEVPVFDYNKFIFSTELTRLADGATGNERSARRVEIDHTGINTFYQDGSAAGHILPVSANAHNVYTRPAATGGTEGPELDGVLTEIQIGDHYWTVPSSISQVAQILPGLSEELSPVPNGNLDLFDQASIGRTNDTTIDDGDSTTTHAWDTDAGNFAFYALADSTTLTINASNEFVYTGTGDLLPERDGVDLALAGTKVFVIANNHLRGITANDVVTIFNNAAGSTNILTFTVDSVSQGVIGGAGTKNAGGDIYVLTTDDVAFTGGEFNIASGDAEIYQMRVRRAGSLAALDTVEFFYGTDHGNHAQFAASIAAADQPTAITLTPGGATQLTIAQDTDLRDAFNGVSTGNKLMFKTEALTAAEEVVGAVVSGNVYEVVGLVYNNGDSPAMSTFSYSLIGQGTMIVNPQELRIHNLPETTQSDVQFLVINSDDTNDRVRTTSISEVAGLQAVASWEDLNSTREGTVASIEFTGGSENHNVVDGGGAIRVDITGRNNFSSFPISGDGTTTSFTADIFHEYLLGNPTAVGQTITLPASATLLRGEKITIHNLADIAADGSPRAYTNHWEVATPGTERIMKDTNNLVLNEAGSFDLIWSGNTAVGWLVK